MPVSVGVGLVRGVVLVVVLVIMVVPVPGQLQNHEPDSGGDQHAAHDGVLGALDRRAELETHGDDHPAQED